MAAEDHGRECPGRAAAAVLPDIGEQLLQARAFYRVLDAAETACCTQA
jgi:hypothetical protein